MRVSRLRSQNLQRKTKKPANSEAMIAEDAKAKELDKFFTVPAVALACLDFLKAKCGRDHIDLWLEPSAGAGAFLDILPPNKVGIDIDPVRSDVAQADFLGWQPPHGCRIATVGNPPFGKNSALAARFFNHAAKFSDIVAFIVPRTFEKASMQDRLDRSFFLVGEKLLAENSFTFLGSEYAVPCVFQVWKRFDKLRALSVRKMNVSDFQFVPSAFDAHFAFQRVGARAGKIYQDDFLWRSGQSHFFIRDTSPHKDVVALLETIEWDRVKYRTAGNPSIAKSELVREYEAARYLRAAA